MWIQLCVFSKFLTLRLCLTVEECLSIIIGLHMNCHSKPCLWLQKEFVAHHGRMEGLENDGRTEY